MGRMESTLETGREPAWCSFPSCRETFRILPKGKPFLLPGTHYIYACAGEGLLGRMTQEALRWAEGFLAVEGRLRKGRGAEAAQWGCTGVSARAASCIFPLLPMARAMAFFTSMGLAM